MRLLNQYRGLALATLGLVVLVSLWVLGGWVLPSLFAKAIPQDHGLFGDRFGAINALFSALAFWGVLAALYVQWRDLREQRRRLDTQTFENKFFQLLAIHNDIVTALDLRARGDAAVVATGRDCFRSFFERKLAQAYQAAAAAEPAGDARDVINAAYTQFFVTNKGDLAHYFSHLYHILKFVDASQIEDKRFYSDLLRGQLSTYEVAILFYHCLSQAGGHLKPLVERFALLASLSGEDLFNPEHSALYPPAAFG